MLKQTPHRPASIMSYWAAALARQRWCALGNPKPEQTLLSAEWIGKARPHLMALIGSLAGVISGQSKTLV